MIKVPHDRTSHTLSKPDTAQHARPSLSILSVAQGSPGCACAVPDVLPIPGDYCVLHTHSTNLALLACTDFLYHTSWCEHTVDGAGERGSDKESICLKMSPLYCLHFSPHLQQGCQIRNISKTKSSWQPAPPLFTDAVLKTVSQVWAAGSSCQGNQKLNQPNIPRSSTKACLCPPHWLCQ